MACPEDSVSQPCPPSSGPFILLAPLVPWAFIRKSYLDPLLLRGVTNGDLPSSLTLCMFVSQLPTWVTDLALSSHRGLVAHCFLQWARILESPIRFHGRMTPDLASRAPISWLQAIALHTSSYPLAPR